MYMHSVYMYMKVPQLAMAAAGEESSDDDKESEEAKTLVKTMKKRLRLVAAQKKAGNDSAALLEDQHKAVLADLQGLVLGSADATYITTEIGTMEWQPAQKRMLAQAVADAAMRQKASPGKRPNQKIDFPEKYWKATTLEACLDASTSLEHKCKSVGQLLYAWGMVCPREKVYTRCSAILLALNPSEFDRRSGQDRELSRQASPMPPAPGPGGACRGSWGVPAGASWGHLVAGRV